MQNQVENPFFIENLKNSYFVERYFSKVEQTTKMRLKEGQSDSFNLFKQYEIPIGIKITFTSHKPIIVSDISIEKALSQVEKVIRDGINFKSPR